MTGRRLLAMARATGSVLNDHRSSSEPPPRPAISASADYSYSRQPMH